VTALEGSKKRVTGSLFKVHISNLAQRFKELTAMKCRSVPVMKKGPSVHQEAGDHEEATALRMHFPRVGRPVVDYRNMMAELDDSEEAVSGAGRF
jgi:hypothetical protein